MEKYPKDFVEKLREIYDCTLFDFTTGHFVKKSELSKEAKEIYQEHTMAHIEHVKKRTQELLDSGVLKR